MNRSKLAVGLYVLVVFLSGVVVGAVGFRLYTATPVRATADEYRQKLVSEMRSRLKLSEDQVRNLNIILDTTRNEFRDFRERHKDEMKAIQENQTKKITDLLSPDQQAEYRRMREEREKHAKGKH